MEITSYQYWLEILLVPFAGLVGGVGGLFLVRLLWRFLRGWLRV